MVDRSSRTARTGFALSILSVAALGCGPSQPPQAATVPMVQPRNLELTTVACEDEAAANEARLAFERAKPALGRFPGVKSVSIAECDVFWAGHFFQSLDPAFSVPAPIGPKHECGVKVAFAGQENLRLYANSAFVFGTFIPYGDQVSVKRARTCGVLVD
jgi:hypothetical protein